MATRNNAGAKVIYEMAAHGTEVVAFNSANGNEIYNNDLVPKTTGGEEKVSMHEPWALMSLTPAVRPRLPSTPQKGEIFTTK